MRIISLFLAGFVSVLLSMLHAWQVSDEVSSMTYLSSEDRYVILINRLNALPLLLLLAGLGFLIATAILLHQSNTSER